MVVKGPELLAGLAGPDVGGSDMDKSGIAADLIYIHAHKWIQVQRNVNTVQRGQGAGFRHKSSEQEVLLLVCCCPQERGCKFLHSYFAADPYKGGGDKVQG